jgi:hypothetical protein
VTATTNDGPQATFARANVSSKGRKRVALIQSAYIPWKGFFDLIGRCDEYIIYDTAAFSKNHWHNRNRIKTSNGARWLSIPVVTAGKMGQRIDETDVVPGWAASHWARLTQAYKRSPFFPEFAPTIEELYQVTKDETKLSAINEVFIRAIAGLLALDVRIVRDTAYDASGQRTDRVVSICRSAGATHYLSGPSADAYLERTKFEEAGIALEWMNYDSYPAYQQPHGAFENNVSILDVIFSLGVKDWKQSIDRKSGTSG